MRDNRRIQGRCLAGDEGQGAHYMREFFDRFPEEVRKRLRHSHWNLCSACVSQMTYPQSVDGFLATIKRIEAVLDEEAKNKENLAP